MVTHVVFFKFAEAGQAEEAQKRLLAMEGRIPGMSHIEAGLDFAKSARSFELALITRHDDRAALDAYQAHPVHQEVVAYIRPRAVASAAVDFE
jgi:hypothetical protein